MREEAVRLDVFRLGETVAFYIKKGILLGLKKDFRIGIRQNKDAAEVRKVVRTVNHLACPDSLSIDDSSCLTANKHEL